MLPLLLVVLPLGALLGALAGLALATLHPRARARRIRDAIGAPPPQLDPNTPGEVTVDGVLVFDGGEDGEIATTTPRGTEGSEVPVLGAATAVSAAGPAVQLEAKRVRLEGPVQVLVGSREGPRRARVLRAGDRVRARGRLSVVASGTAEGSYRDPSAELHLAPPSDDEWKVRPIPVAFLGHPKPRRALPAALGAVAAASAVLGFALSRGGAPPHAAPPHAAPPPAAPAERPACAGEIDALVDAGQHWAARERAAACDDPLAQARVHWMLGDFEAASRAYAEARSRRPALDPTVTEAEAHALAGDPARAAGVVRAMAETWYRGPETTERRRLLCIADALAAHVDPAAHARLKAAYDTRKWPDRPELDCALLLADRASDVDGRVWSLQTNDDRRALRRLLIAEAGSGAWFTHTYLFDDTYPLPAMKDPRAWIHFRPLAVEKRIAEGARATPLRAECAADVGLFYAFMGDRASAAAMLAKVPDVGPDRTNHVVAAIAAAHAGDWDGAARFMRLGADDSNAVAAIARDVALLRGDPSADPGAVGAEEPWTPNREIFAAARTGDGAVVAAELERLRADARMTLLRVWPRLTKNRDALLRWLEHRYPAPCTTCGLFALAESTGTRLVLARAMEHRALEQQLAPIAQRLTEAVLDRTYAMPFLLLESFVR